METFFSIVILLVVVVGCMTYIKYTQDKRPFAEHFESVSTTPGLLTLKPTLWWFVDDEVNARSWWDFGARNSREPNRGYLQVALQAAQATQAFDFTVVPLVGRAAVAQVIKEAGENVPPYLDQLPAKLWRQWAVANLAATKGGLVMVGDSTLCVGPSFGPLVKDADCAVFGISADEPRAVPGMTALPPAPWVAWAKRPHTPCWDIAASTWNRLVAAGPTAWSAAEARRIAEKIWATQRLKNPAHFQDAEGSRKADGTELTPEDFLQKQTNPVDPKTTLSPATFYITMDGDALVRDYRYGWFARMSREQILASNFYWATLAKKHMSRLVPR